MSGPTDGYAADPDPVGDSAVAPDRIADADADAALLADLRALLAPDAEPPPEVLSAARECFVWRTVDAELADLTFDSLLDAEPARSRAGEEIRTLTFEAGALTIELEIGGAHLGRQLTGQLVPPQAAELELRRGADLVVATADEMGRFRLPLTTGHQRITLRLRLADGTEVVSAAAIV